MTLVVCVGVPTTTGISVGPASPSKRSTILALASVSPKVVDMPRISSSGLRKASAIAKASSISAPMSVSMMTFSGAVDIWAGLGACALATGAACMAKTIENRTTATEKRTSPPSRESGGHRLPREQFVRHFLEESLSHSERWQSLILGHFHPGSYRMYRLNWWFSFRLRDLPGLRSDVLDRKST